MTAHERHMIARKKQRQHNRIMSELGARSGWRCEYCGIDVSDASVVEATIDHVKPREQGGTLQLLNVKLACEFCNRAKAQKHVTEFLAWLNFVRQGAISGN